MSKKTEYLLNVYNLIDEEFFILNNSDEYKEIKEISPLQKLWNNKEIDELSDQLSELFVNNRVSFIIPEEQEESASYKEISILRLFTLLSISTDILEVIPTIDEEELYQRLEMIYQNADFDFSEIVSLTKVAREYLKEFEVFIDAMEIPKPLEKQLTRVKGYIQKILDSKNIETFYKEIYELFDYVNSFLDSMEGHEFDWEKEQVVMANNVFAWILFVESIVYYIVLLKEKYIDIQEQKNGIQIQDRIDVLEQRNDTVKELKMIKKLNINK